LDAIRVEPPFVALVQRRVADWNEVRGEGAARRGNHRLRNGSAVLSVCQGSDQRSSGRDDQEEAHMRRLERFVRRSNNTNNPHAREEESKWAVRRLTVRGSSVILVVTDVPLTVHPRPLTWFSGPGRGSRDPQRPPSSTTIDTWKTLCILICKQ